LGGDPAEIKQLLDEIVAADTPVDTVLEYRDVVKKLIKK
jgi:hypothetical protein